MLIAILESLEVTQSILKSLRQIVLIITGKVLTMPTRTSITRADEREARTKERIIIVDHYERN